MSSKSKFGWILLSGASLAAMGALTPAFAQQQPADEQSEEIVVTATGRAAAIQDVPIAVTAVGHEQLEDAGVRGLVDLRQVTPNLRIGSGQSQTSGTAAAIRGIGTGSDNPGFEASVGIFIDGVYRARAGGAIDDLADVERVEILRGPQGTLYGKNTTAGAISVVTAAPDFTFGAWLEGTVGDRDLLGTRFGVNVPLSDTMAIRVDGTMRGADGYLHDVVSGNDIQNTDRWSGRAQFLWDINSDATLRVIWDQAGINEDCCGAVTFADTSLPNISTGFPGAPFAFSLSANLTQPGSVLTADPQDRRTSVSPARSYNEQSDDGGISAQLDWDLGGVNLTSISSYRDWDSTRDQDIDFSRMDRSYRDGLRVGVESATQELRLQGEWGRVNWLVGGFYGHERVSQVDNIRYGAQAGSYINNLLGLFDFTAAGEAVDHNTAFLPGTGDTVFGCTPDTTPGVPVTGSSCALDYAYQAFFGLAGPLSANAAVPGTSAVLAGSTGTFSAALSAASLNGAGQNNDHWNVDTNSYALFTHNEVNITDSLVLTIGARWTHEEKDLVAQLNGSQAACDAIRANQDSVYAALVIRHLADLALPASNSGRVLADGLPGALTLACNPAVNNVQVLANGGHYTNNFNDEAVTGTASLAYHLNDDLMIYGGYSRGYKSGGFNIDRSGMNVFPWSSTAPLSAYAQSAAAYLGLDTTPSFGADDLGFDPETIDAYEVGFKSTLFGGSTTFNVAGFYEQLHDFQLNAFNGFNFITRNVPEVISQGVELEVATRPIQNMQVTFGALYNDASYDSTVVFGVNPSDVVNSGDPLAQSPEWTLSGSVGYMIPVGGDMHINLYANGRWVSDYRLQTLGRNPLTDQQAFAIFDARVGLAGNSDRWGVDIFVRNLTDEYYSLGAFGVTEQSLYQPLTGQVEGRFAAFPNEPRTVGITLHARY